MRLGRILFLSAGATFFLSSPVLSQEGMDPELLQRQLEKIEKHQDFQLEQVERAQEMGADDFDSVRLPIDIVEPDIPPVKFMQQDPPGSLAERIDSLTYGIKVDLPPEYDVYGYELRRYMAHIGSTAVLNDKQRRDEELKNIAKAKIILKYWREAITKEISEIGKAIEETNASSDARSKYKYNSGLATAFLSECDVWIQKNEAMLKFFEGKEGSYKYKNGAYMFLNSEDNYALGSHYKAALEARNIINQYLPFRQMVY